MISSYERADLIHIMKINRLALSERDTAQLVFNGRMGGDDYEVAILVIDDVPSAVVKRGGELVHTETVKSVDDLKIFLEERLYRYLTV